jgi:ABC-2 type transport system permease protein
MALLMIGFEPITAMLGRWASPRAVEVIAGFSVLTHFDGFQKGVLDTRDLLYFLSVIGFALFTTGVIVRNRRAG